MKDTCQWTTVVNLKMKNIPETIIVAGIRVPPELTSKISLVPVSVLN